MSLFSGLSEKLNHIFSKIKSRGKLTELEIKQAMREIRIALLEADVNFSVVKDFIARVSEKAVGETILNSLTPGQQVVKLVNDELIALMGSAHAKLEVSSKPPTVIMLCGLQGAGKTTMCGKLAQYLIKNGKNPLLVACQNRSGIGCVGKIQGLRYRNYRYRGKTPHRRSVDERVERGEKGSRAYRNFADRRRYDGSGRGYGCNDVQ